MGDRTYKVSFRFICDRQDLLKIMETRKQGLEPYMFDRDDMYWAEVKVEDSFLEAELSYLMDHYVTADGISWSLSFQYGPNELNTEHIRKLVMKHWDKSQEKVQAEVWVRNLVEGGYYKYGRWPGANSAPCPHCGHMWEKGTSHPHTYLKSGRKKEIIYHHRQMEKTIKERGLTKFGFSALPDVPSLEELGKLETVVIQ